MLAFRDIPIRRKLVILIMITTSAALIVAGSGVVLVDAILFRSGLRRDLATLSRIIADNSTAALAFDDSQSAAETLASLRERTHVVSACIYRLDGTVFATYARQGIAICPPIERNDHIRLTNQNAVVFQSIVLAGQRVGTLTLLYDLGEAYERVRLNGGTVLGVLLASTLLAFLMASKLRAVIATPISRLVHATTSVSETGDYSTRAEKLSGDELGVLVDRFNEMLAGIQSRESALKKALLDREAALRDADQERERFRFMAESMPQKIFTARPDGTTDYLNAQWAEFTGLPVDELQGWGWTQFVHPEDLEENIRAWRQSFRTGEPFHMEHRFRRMDGKYRWHLTRAHAMRDAAGAVSTWIGSSTEIQEQKEKEEALRRANDDLQQFAYSASHDLQEPIRNVSVYSEIVAERYRDRLDSDGQQFLGFLQEGGRRLATLINDLLAYTRAGMMEVQEAPVNSTEVLKHTLSSLAEAIRESGAEVTYDNLPEIFIGDSHMQQIFQNLIANALKYRDRDQPRVHVSAEIQGSYWRFSVADNGIGIDPKYKEKIFGVFKRLHHDRKYSGTGIGLAICQRVVERYGGRIWVDSEPGKGSTFFFTVPRRGESIASTAAESSVGGG